MDQLPHSGRRSAASLAIATVIIAVISHRPRRDGGRAHPAALGHDSGRRSHRESPYDRHLHQCQARRHDHARAHVPGRRAGVGS